MTNKQSPRESVLQWCPDCDCPVCCEVIGKWLIECTVCCEPIPMSATNSHRLHEAAEAAEAVV